MAKDQVRQLPGTSEGTAGGTALSLDGHRGPARDGGQVRHTERNAVERIDLGKQPSLPTLLTSSEVAALLRTSRKAVYAMAERAQLPGVVRINRRLLFREDALLDWLRQKSTPSLER